MVAAGDREVRVSSPDRVIYEASEWTPAITKLQVCEYFAAVAEPLMRTVGHRPVAMERWPSGWRDGMRLATGPQDREGEGFYQKRLPKGAPDWLQTVQVHTPNGRPIDELCPSEPAAFVWAAQMGTLTFHPWAVRCSNVDQPDELRIDLDPDDGANFEDVKRVASATNELLTELGLKPYVKTSGSRGLHVYLRLEPRYSFQDLRHAAIGLGRELERRGTGVTTSWWREERPKGSVFIDFNQNLEDRSVAGAWSLRARAGAPVSTPLTWPQLDALTDLRDYNILTVPDHLAAGDPWHDMDETAHALESLLELWAALPGGELNYPPDYPKMPNEPPRVQPSKKVAGHWDAEGNRIGT